jgi:diguanylate cyclase (GGDEF)-like protein
MLSSDVVAALNSLAETAVGTSFTIDELLHDLCMVAARALDVDGAGVVILEPAGLRFIHASPEHIVDVEVLQEVLQRSPCRDAMVDRKTVVVDDIAQSDRWPEFAAAAAAAELRATVAMPLLARGQAWGALDVYRDHVWSWTTEQLSLVQLFAGLAASYLVMAADRDLAATVRLTLEHQASHDELTGLPGRGLMFTLLEHALPSANRRGTAVAVLFIDLDDFKNINDTLGHAAGDQVLIKAAHRLARALRKGDTIIRLAGDEFVFICEDLPQDAGHAAAQIQALGSRLAGAISRPMQITGNQLIVSASIGIAVAGAGSTPENLLANADHAMYSAKQRGRGQVVISDDHRVDTNTIPTQRHQ